MKRTRCCENLALRLAKREVAGAPPGAVAPHNRRFYENIAPDTQVPGPVPPPNTVLACFTPCGRFLLGFQPVANEVVAYRFKGLHTSASTHAAVQGTEQQQQQQSAGSGEQQQQQPEAGGQQQRAANGVAPQQQQQPQQQLDGVAFGDIFEEHWRCSPCPNRQEQLSPDLCLVAHGRFVLVCSASPEWQPPAGAATSSASVVPRVERTTFHVIDLESGVLVDSHTLQDDYVELARSQGVHLRGQLLLVLGLGSQTLHMLQLLPTGRLHYLHAIGPHCRDDDALVLAQHEERERRLRQQQHRPQHASGVPPAAAAGVAPVLSTSQGASSQQQQQQQQQPGRGLASGQLDPRSTAVAGQAPRIGDPAAGPAAMPAAAAAAPTAAPAGRAPTGAPAGVPAGRAAAGQQATGGAILGGLKQQLLAYLFREAQRQSAEAAASASGGPEPPAASEPQPRGLGGLGGSTASLLSAVAPTQPRGFTSVGGQGGSTSSLRGLGGSTSSLGGLGGGEGGKQPQSAAHPHWRRPLDRFHYYFEAYAEMLMWKAQLLDEQRLLIHWVAPDMLAAPHRHHGHSSASHAAQAGGGAYLMLYNYCTATVERLFVAGSPDLATWYMQQPAAFLASSCPCGCTTDWQRCLVPLGGSRAAREAQLRDPALAVKELRHRLWDELPASSQPRQATPYLDPDLYCFDEQVGGAVRAHHPPHRALKFMARCCPEALRFRLEPEHFAPRRGGGAGGRGGAARPQHVVYLFHPLQPFLMAVLQDIETGLAERLALWTRQ